jgi:hypothetical protein
VAYEKGWNLPTLNLLFHKELEIHWLFKFTTNKLVYPSKLGLQKLVYPSKLGLQKLVYPSKLALQKLVYPSKLGLQKLVYPSKLGLQKLNRWINIKQTQKVRYECIPLSLKIDPIKVLIYNNDKVFQKC